MQVSLRGKKMRKRNMRATSSRGAIDHLETVNLALNTIAHTAAVNNNAVNSAKLSEQIMQNRENVRIYCKITQKLQNYLVSLKWSLAPPWTSCHFPPPKVHVCYLSIAIFF
eukprot:GEMP01036187.1.p1 GENE.GEMP01036187.1~~GEMP01036187.1.p1  ORF type:complete len:111 (-),score=2.56 GEMP01036187.1:1561-1893(-)